MRNQSFTIPVPMRNRALEAKAPLLLVEVKANRITVCAVTSKGEKPTRAQEIAVSRARRELTETNALLRDRNTTLAHLVDVSRPSTQPPLFYSMLSQLSF